MDNQRSKPSTRKSRKTVAHIAQVADTIIRRDGRDNFTMKDLATEAEVAAGLPYRYWPSRAALIKDLYPNAIEGLGTMRKFDE